MAPTILQAHDMVKLQNFLSQSAPRTEKSSNLRRKGGYTVAVHNIYGIPTPPPEENQK